MKCRLAICSIAVLLAGVPVLLEAQEQPGSRAGAFDTTSAGRNVPTAAAAGAPASALPQDTLPVDTLVGPRLRLGGGLVRELPADDASRLLRFLPGFGQTASGQTAYRARNAMTATYVDGVPVRSLIRGGPVLVPAINALESVELTSGAVSASRVGATVVDYTTLEGGAAWTADMRALSDAAAPGGWKQHVSRMDLRTSGPVPGVPGLRLSVAGQLAGQKYRQLPGSGPAWVATGIDTTFLLQQGSGDYAEVVVPTYEQTDFRRLPLGNADRSDVTTGLTFRRDRGAYTLRYHRTSEQAVSRALEHLYDPDAWRGQDDVAQVISLSLQRPLVLGMDADVVLSHQRLDATYGMLSPAWAASHAQPALGIMSGSLGFLANRDDWPVTEPVLLALRSGVFPPRSMTLMTSDHPLAGLRQGVSGVAQVLRLNPYGARAGFPVAGAGNTHDPALSWATERRWYGRASLSRQVGSYRVDAGGELDRSRVESFTLPLADGIPVARRENPASSAAFVSAAATLGGLQVDGGVRVEHQSSDVMLPRLPGFVTFVPDSLRGDAYLMRAGDEPWEQRLERVTDCGGAATAANRTNPVTGAVVCRDNFLQVRSHTAVSPRIAVAYSGEGRLGARAAVGSFVQPRALAALPSRDLATVNTGTPQPGDTDPVRENVAEIGVRFRTTQGSWLDMQVFRLDVTNPVVFRFAPFVNPVTAAPTNVLVSTNGDSEVTRGIELTALQRLGSWSGVLAAFGVSSTERPYINGAQTRTDPLRASGILWVDLGHVKAPSPVSAVLRDLRVHATALYSEGERYTRLLNVGDGHRVGRLPTPPGGTAGGTAAEEFDASRLPGRTEFDLRVTKGFDIRGVTARLVADVRNPLGIRNVHTVFAETGTTENEIYRERLTTLTLSAYSGQGFVRDMVIDEQTTENELNRYMLHRAEQRFGDGDGIFTVTEMANAVNAYLDLLGGPQWLSEDRRELRLGLELRF